jgi:hypothetical protein
MTNALKSLLEDREFEFSRVLAKSLKAKEAWKNASILFF